MLWGESERLINLYSCFYGGQMGHKTRLFTWHSHSVYCRHLHKFVWLNIPVANIQVRQRFFKYTFAWFWSLFSSFRSVKVTRKGTSWIILRIGMCLDPEKLYQKVKLHCSLIQFCVESFVSRRFTRSTFFISVPLFVYNIQFSPRLLIEIGKRSETWSF